MANEQRTEFFVNSMKCNGCVTNATNAISGLPGYQGAEFDLESGTAIVTGAIDPQAVCQALTEAGYPAVVKSH